MEHTVNQIKLRGQLKQLPEFSHENHGRRFSRLYLDVPRLSGAVDTVPVIADEALLRDLPTVCGTTLSVTGQIRSHNIRSEGRRRLLIFVFAESIIIEDGCPSAWDCFSIYNNRYINFLSHLYLSLFLLYTIFP